MKEIVSHEKLDAIYAAFAGERLRWLIGKGDLLVQNGELEFEYLQKLITKTLQEEFERNMILAVLETGEKTITEIARKTKMDPYNVFKNILALMKWNKVMVSRQKGNEYLYAIAEVIADNSHQH